MQSVYKYSALCFILLFLAGCSINHALNTKRFEVVDEDMTVLDVKKSVAVVNASLKKEKEVICKLLMHKHNGSLYEFTNAACESVKDLLHQQDIEIDQNAEKQLHLSVERAYCDYGFKDRGMTELKVKTGDGLEKTYNGQYNNWGGGYTWTLTFERSMAVCLKKMLHDQDIIDYLEN